MGFAFVMWVLGFGIRSLGFGFWGVGFGEPHDVAPVERDIGGLGYGEEAGALNPEPLTINPAP